jgi:hypothetical protein
MPGQLTGHKGDHFPWQKWCDYGWKHQLVLMNWDANVMPPGPDFIVKGAGAVTTDGWHLLVRRIDWKDNPFRDPAQPTLDIIPWTDREQSFPSFLSTNKLINLYLQLTNTGMLIAEI